MQSVQKIQILIFHITKVFKFIAYFKIHFQVFLSPKCRYSSTVWVHFTVKHIRSAFWLEQNENHLLALSI